MSDEQKRIDFDDSQIPAEEYENFARKFIPGYDGFYALCEVLLAENLPETAEILIVGAGGGKEISAFGKAFPAARFLGVDPSEKMLAVAQSKVESENLASLVTLVRGTIDAVDERQFDAGSALLVMHFLPDDGEKLDFLKAINRRLKPGAKFLIADGCFDKNSADFDWLMRAYQSHARRNGAPEEILTEAVAGIREKVYGVSEGRELELFQTAGFGNIKHFYKGLWFNGWLLEKLD